MTTEDDIVGWHHRHKFEQAPGDGEEQGSWASPSGKTEMLSNNGV